MPFNTSQQQLLLFCVLIQVISVYMYIYIYMYTDICFHAVNIHLHAHNCKKQQHEVVWKYLQQQASWMAIAKLDCPLETLKFRKQHPLKHNQRKQKCTKGLPRKSSWPALEFNVCCCGSVWAAPSQATILGNRYCMPLFTIAVTQRYQFGCKSHSHRRSSAVEAVLDSQHVPRFRTEIRQSYKKTCNLSYLSEPPPRRADCSFNFKLIP